MRIIKRGSPPDKLLYFITCNRCQSELEVNRFDANESADYRYTSSLTIDCPVCAKKLVFMEQQSRKASAA